MSIAAVAVAGVLADSILPEGEITKYVRGVFALCLTLVILLPLPKLLNSNFEFNLGAGSTNEDIIDTSLLERTEGLINAQYEREITAALASEGISVSLAVSGQGARSAVVWIEKRSDEPRVRAVISNYLGIDKGRIIVHVGG